MFAGTHQECHARRCYRDRICSQRQRGRFPPSRCCAEGAARLGTHAAWRRTFASNAGLLCGNGCTLHLLALYQRSESRFPPPTASLSPPPQHQMPISLARWVRAGDNAYCRVRGQGGEKQLYLEWVFPSPRCQAQGSTGRQGGRASARRSRWQRGRGRKARGPERAVLDGSRCAGAVPRAALSGCLLTACWLLALN